MKTNAVQSTPRIKGEHKQGTDARGPGATFVSLALNMSWQLAIVVLVPVIGGFELDKKLDILPALTIVGFIVAMAGMAAVVWRQLQLFAPPPASPQKRKGAHP